MPRMIRYIELWMYLLCLVLAYHIVRAYRYFFTVEIDWVETVTLWQKIKVFYTEDYSLSICPAVIVSIFLMISVLLLMRDKRSIK